MRPDTDSQPETWLSSDTVAAIDADANRQLIGRTEWLLQAVDKALPYDALDRSGRVDASLRAVDAWLDNTRTWAQDAEAPTQERVHKGIAYAECIAHMRAILKDALHGIPVRELNAAYSQAKSASADETPELAKLLGRAMGAEFAASILESLILTLPMDDTRVAERAELDNPLADLE